MRDVNAEIIATAFRRIIFNNVLHSSALNAVLILETPACAGSHPERDAHGAVAFRSSSHSKGLQPT